MIRKRCLASAEAESDRRKWDRIYAFVATQGHAGHRFSGSSLGDEPMAYWCDTCQAPIGVLNPEPTRP